MAQENYVEGCSMQRPHLLEPNGFCFWKACFETYVKSKDFDLWQVIKTAISTSKLMKEMPNEILKYTEKKQLGKNEEAKMTIYNSLPRKEIARLIFSLKKKLSISSDETIDSGFTRFNTIVTSLKSLDPDYSNKNHVRKFLHALPLKWRAKVTAIEEAKDLAVLPLDELIRNLKVYEMFLDNDDVATKTTKDKVKSLALKAKVTRDQTSNDSDSQDGSDEGIDEEEAKAFNLLARNFRKGNRFGRGNHFGNRGNMFGKGRGNGFENKGGESSTQKGACYNFGIEGHFASECRKPKKNKAFMEGAWSDSEDGDEHQMVATCLMPIDSKEVVSKPSSSNNDLNIIDLQKENEELLKFNKDFTKTFEKLLKEKYALEDKNSKLSSKINDLEIKVAGTRYEVLYTSVPGTVHVSTRYCSGGGCTNQMVTRGTGMCQSKQLVALWEIGEWEIGEWEF
ncbi:zf-CCHC domain-containing protein [Tanacetum coccineum]